MKSLKYMYLIGRYRSCIFWHFIMTKILIMSIKFTCFKQHMYQTGLWHSRVLIRKTQKRGSQNSHNDFGYWISCKFTIASICGSRYVSDSNKVGCVFRMIISTEFRMWQYWDDYREEAPQFRMTFHQVLQNHFLKLQ